MKDLLRREVIGRGAQLSRHLLLAALYMGTAGMPCRALAAQTPVTPARTDSIARAGAARADSLRADSIARRSPIAPLLQRVNVTAERARAVPPPVARIDVDATALRATPASNAYDLVRRTAGIEVHEQGQGPGFTSNAVIRGFNSDHSADVLLVVDGIPINAPVHGHVEGFADWNVLLPVAVQSMRVIHGTASPLYGDFSLAGVVEVFTAADAAGTTATLGTSSFGDASLAALTGYRGVRSGALAALDVRRQHGWQQHSGYVLGNGLLRGWRATLGGRLEGGVQYYRSRWDSPGFTSIARYNTYDLRAAVDSTDGGTSRRLLASARYSRGLPRLIGRPLALETTVWVQRAAQTMYLNVPGTGNVARQSGEDDDRRGAGGGAQLVWQVPLGEMVVGTTARADRATYTLQNTLARQPSSLDHAYDARFWSSGSYLRFRRLVANRLAVDLGGRFDLLHHESFDRLANAGWRDGTMSVVSPKLGARYLLPWSPGALSMSMLGSSSYGFRSPPGIIADPTRAPYLAWSHETGVEIERGDISVHAALFRIDTRNERVFDPVTLGISSAGRSRRQGIDARTSWRLPSTVSRVIGADTVTVGGAVTVNDARFLGAVAGDSTRPANTGAFHDHNVPILPGDPVPGVSRYTARLGAALSIARLRGVSARTSYRILGPFTPIGEPGVRTRAASILDIGATLPLRRAASIDVDVQNVFGLRYVENRASGFITPGIPRVLRASLRLSP